MKKPKLTAHCRHNNETGQHEGIFPSFTYEELDLMIKELEVLAPNSKTLEILKGEKL